MRTGSPVWTERSVARLMMLAVWAMMLGQVVAMPSGSLSVTNGSFDQQSTLAPHRFGAGCARRALSSPWQRVGFRRCFAGNCPMLTFALPVTPSAAWPMAFRALVYRHDSVPLPDGTRAAPLLPPPRPLV
jgi:hypothetical protein